MASSRELAEKAFALLQSALRDSESKVSELDAELKKKRTPKNRVEERADVLAHRLEGVEAECLRWQREASQLEEIIANERARVAQLKKKLEVAESGPDKLTKREVNFWRQRAEQFDVETREYKKRIALLKNELRERDAQKDDYVPERPPNVDLPARADAAAGFELSAVLAAAASSVPDTTALEAELGSARAELQVLRGRLLERDRDLSFAASAEQSGDAQASSLRNELAAREAALADAQRTCEGLRADLERVSGDLRRANDELARANDEIARRSSAASETGNASENLAEQLRDRETRLVEISAELEKTRAELAAKASDHQHLNSEIEAARRELQDRDSQLAELGQVEKAAYVERDQLRGTLAERERDLEKLAAELAARGQDLERTTAELAERNRTLEAGSSERDERERTLALELDQARRGVEERGSELERLEAELGTLRDSHEARAADLAARDTDLERTRADLDQARTHLDEARADLEEARSRIEEHRAAAASHTDDMQSLQAAKSRLDDEIEALRTATDRLEGELTSIRGDRDRLEREAAEIRELKARLESELSDAISRADESRTEHRETIESLNREIAARDDRIAELEQDRSAVREQIAGLEEELKEEKEAAENLRELANERREAISKLEERLDEAEERFAEAQWQLGKAAHFERLVYRRKGLVRALIAEVRAKAKANTALKAGLDGLRTFKATAEQNQQKLVARIDKLTGKLKEAEETIEKYQGETVTKEELLTMTARATDLEGRINTQVELIESLETDLKQAKASRQSHEDQAGEIDRLHQEIEAKNEAITRLEADADEQQRKLAKLRGSESETMRLKAIQEKDAGLIESLQREIDELRAELDERQADAADGGAASLNGAGDKLKERDSTISRLTGTVKEQGKEIERLNEAVAAWQRKYQFLSTEAPDAYKSVAGK